MAVEEPVESDGVQLAEELQYNILEVKAGVELAVATLSITRAKIFKAEPVVAWKTVRCITVGGAESVIEPVVVKLCTAVASSGAIESLTLKGS